jgi:ATP-dependent helicase HrpB
VRSDVLERWLAVGGALNGRRDARLRLGAADAIARAARQIAASAGGRPWQARELRSDVGIQETLLRALLAAYPDRVARRREPRSPRAVMVGGHGVRLSPASRVRGEPLFVCVVIGGSTGGTTGGGGRETLVHSASGIEEAWLDARTEETAELDVESGRVRVRRRRLYRDLVLDEIDAGPAAPEHSAPLLLRWALRDPRSALGLDRPEIECFLTRVACLCEWVPELGLPDLESGLEAGTRSEALAETGFEPMSEGAAAALDALSPTWRGIVEAAVAGARTTAEITQAPVLDLLRGTIPWELQRRLDELVPERIELPSGRRAEIRYQRGEPPVLAARIQELFGWRETPRIAGGRVPLVLHLLAPNLRPQQVTDDLAGFWRRTYPEVRKELAGRYPKHPWPADGASAEPVRGAGRRR